MSTPYIDVNEFEMFNNKPECQSNHNFEKIYKTYKGFYFKNLGLTLLFFIIRCASSISTADLFIQALPHSLPIFPIFTLTRSRHQ